MRTYNVSTVVAAFVAVAIAGCAGVEPVQRVDCASGRFQGFTAREAFPVTPYLDCAFGDAVNMAIARQTLDAKAGVRNAGRDAAGLDGAAARDAMYNYQKSFRTPEPATNEFTISVGGGQSSGGQ